MASYYCKLAEIRIEDIKFVEESIGISPKTMMPSLDSTNGQLQVPSLQVPSYTRETIDCNQAAQKYKGAVFIERYNVKKTAHPQAPCLIIDSNQAAQKYKGVVIAEYGVMKNVPRNYPY